MLLLLFCYFFPQQLLGRQEENYLAEKTFSISNCMTYINVKSNFEALWVKSGLKMVGTTGSKLWVILWCFTKNHMQSIEIDHYFDLDVNLNKTTFPNNHNGGWVYWVLLLSITTMAVGYIGFYFFQ